MVYGLPWVLHTGNMNVPDMLGKQRAALMDRLIYDYTAEFQVKDVKICSICL